jgi:RecB family exonuclease
LIQQELRSPLLNFLESGRLKARIKAWLEIEKTRPEFTVIAREASAVLSLAALLFHLRLDRVDKLADGSRVVIDYKTGEVNPKDWFQDRLEAPQLPMYAVLGQYTSVFYASLKAGKMGLFGAEHLTAEQLEKWRTQLERLAIEFKEGFAVVAPSPTACQYCHLQAMCRIHEKG